MDAELDLLMPPVRQAYQQIDAAVRWNTEITAWLAEQIALRDRLYASARARLDNVAQAIADAAHARERWRAPSVDRLARLKAQLAACQSGAAWVQGDAGALDLTTSCARQVAELTAIESAADVELRRLDALSRAAATVQRLTPYVALQIQFAGFHDAWQPMARQVLENAAAGLERPSPEEVEAIAAALLGQDEQLAALSAGIDEAIEARIEAREALDATLQGARDSVQQADSKALNRRSAVLTEASFAGAAGGAVLGLIGAALVTRHSALGFGQALVPLALALICLAIPFAVWMRLREMTEFTSLESYEDALIRAHAASRAYEDELAGLEWLRDQLKNPDQVGPPPAPPASEVPDRTDVDALRRNPRAHRVLLIIAGLALAWLMGALLFTGPDAPPATSTTDDGKARAARMAREARAENAKVIRAQRLAAERAEAERRRQDAEFRAAQTSAPVRRATARRGAAPSRDAGSADVRAAKQAFQAAINAYNRGYEAQFIDAFASTLTCWFEKQSMSRQALRRFYSKHHFSIGSPHQNMISGLTGRATGRQVRLSYRHRVYDPRDQTTLRGRRVVVMARERGAWRIKTWANPEAKRTCYR